MIKNFFTIALRTFLRGKVISLIHVVGLSIGISASLIIFLIARHEFGFDNFEPDRERIYRVVMDFEFNGVDGHSAAVPAPLANAVEREIANVEETVPIMQFHGDGTAKVSIVNARLKPLVFKRQPDIVFTTGDYFDLVPYEWLAGNPESALKDPFSTVLSEGRARQYFPEIPLREIPGKQIAYNDIDVTVTGIVKDLGNASDLSFLEFVSYPTIAKTALQNQFMMDVWDDWMAYSNLYLKLGSDNNKPGTEAGLNQLFRKYNKRANLKDHRMSLVLQPLSEVHFDPNYAGFNQRIANKQSLSGLLAIAAFLLILACINFVNLSTALAARRSKEVGIRKLAGSPRRLLVVQFLSETFCITSLAIMVSISLAPALLEWFSDFVPAGVSFSLAGDPAIVVFLAAVAVVVTLLAGLYPALILSGFLPVAALKNQLTGSATHTGGIRKMLTVSQFVVAQFFIIAAFIVSKQIRFSMTQDLGYRKEAIITFPIPRDTVADHAERIRNEIESIPGVEMVSLGFLPPAMEGAAFGNVRYRKGNGEEVRENVQVRWGDPNYIRLYRIGLVAGRNIRGGSNIDEVLINETYARTLGFQIPGEALQKELIMGVDSRYTIVGIMRDFHESSFRERIGPIVFRSRDDGNFFHVALMSQNGDVMRWQTTIRKIEKVFLSVYPEEEFNYAFFDDTIAKFYAAEQRMSRLLNWSMGLSILISCLGLLGLVMYTAETRTKEIGIRKILGATASDLISILSVEFIRLVVIAFFIAVPLAWWSMHQWLEGFAYRTSMSWWVFVVSGLLLMTIAMITISVQTFKAATADPVKNIRAE